VAEDITAHLQAWQNGDRRALDQAMPELYATLRQIAVQRLGREQGVLTLEPTDLVHEALARVLGAESEPANRRHFLALGALYMRSILTDRARAIRAGRRPGAGLTVTLGHAQALHDGGALDLLALEDALHSLEAEDARAARVLELNTFSGMQRDEIAELLSLSVPTVDRDLRFARAWINRALE
jgi:RNA polymerase sigma factor (TIGR02999 family)